MRAEVPDSLVQALAHLLRGHGGGVLDGTSNLTLLTPSMQVVARLFQQLVPRIQENRFQALPAHPTGSDAVLRAQFLLDILQKTRSLKIIHPPDCPRHFDVTIFPFKSLRILELRGLTPQCLMGLQKVYSQLEVLTCLHCVTALYELIARCGGDMSIALPWLELHTLNLSYNNIHDLDDSLDLLSCLRTLDLSHNYLTDCDPYIKLLYDLHYLNLGYNMLVSIPELSVTSAIRIRTLILRYNQLSSTKGLGELVNLLHFDLSYNLLLDHSQLCGLAGLHKLRKLFLEGNPLHYHPDHRGLTAQHLSRKFPDKQVILDGMEITAEEMSFAQREPTSQSQHDNSVAESSNVAEQCESSSATEKTPQKRKVKVRTASISEPSDSDLEQRWPPPIVLQHQEEIERINSFREMYGVDWLQYRPHLEEELKKIKNVDVSPKKILISQPFTKSKSSPTILQKAGRSNSSSPDTANPGPANPSTSEVSADTAAADLLIERIEDVLEDGLWERRKVDKKEEVVDDVIVGALCSPVTVCPILDGKPLNPSWPWIFLRVTRQHLVEIDLERGRVKIRRELHTLKDIQTSVTPWRWMEGAEEQDLPVLTLYFHSLCEDKQCAQYVVVDNTKEISIKTLLNVLNPILENNLKGITEGEEAPAKLQCLKCRTEFTHQEDSDAAVSSEGERRTRDKTPHGLHSNHSDHTSCPSCKSLHVILAPTEQSSGSSSPTQSSPTDQPPEGAQSEGPKSFYVGDEPDSSETGSSYPDRSNSTATPEGNLASLLGSYKYPSAPSRQESVVIQDDWQLSPTSVSAHQTLDFRIVDHRLKLYLDMDILRGEMEEFQCCMKVPVVRFGIEGPFCALVVVTNEKIYFLEIIGEMSGPPCDWLHRGEEQTLSSLTHLHIGLEKQTLHLGFSASEAAYTLLTRNARFSTVFSKYILETMASLPSRYLKDLHYSEEETVTESHHLWPLLHEKPDVFRRIPRAHLYALAYFLQDKDDKPANSSANATVAQENMASSAARAQGAGKATPVSLLLTGTHLFILEESHQWLHTPSPAGEGSAQEDVSKVQVKEKQPISNISSVHLYSSAALHLRIQLYNETQQKESAWLLWMEDADLPLEVVGWLRVPWEAEYRIPFNEVIHESLN